MGEFLNLCHSLAPEVHRVPSPSAAARAVDSLFAQYWNGTVRREFKCAFVSGNVSICRMAFDDLIAYMRPLVEQRDMPLTYAPYRLAVHDRAGARRFLGISAYGRSIHTLRGHQFDHLFLILDDVLLELLHNDEAAMELRSTRRRISSNFFEVDDRMTRQAHWAMALYPREDSTVEVTLNGQKTKAHVLPADNRPFTADRTKRKFRSE